MWVAGHTFGCGTVQSVSGSDIARTFVARESGNCGFPPTDPSSSPPTRAGQHASGTFTSCRRNHPHHPTTVHQPPILAPRQSLLSHFLLVTPISLPPSREMEQYNSGTYTGVSLYALSLWGYMPKNSTIVSRAADIITKIWEDVGYFYNPTLHSLGPPWDRAYGYDMVGISLFLETCIFNLQFRSRSNFTLVFWVLRLPD